MIGRNDFETIILRLKKKKKKALNEYELGSAAKRKMFKDGFEVGFFSLQGCESLGLYN